ncbi:unnamed protein product [Adineta steineri]|uniref:Uncharacterized protein n=1 Tax=Adineta steineri TaxID=433720 RepID=A0A815U0H7_9BILA|nr:unnamed protein product [Adineta steineri]CAF1647560.1 unnamed protein product [Adineta steineri]
MNVCSTNSSYVEEIKSKLKKLDIINKTTARQPLPRISIKKNLPIRPKVHTITSEVRNRPSNSVYSKPIINPSADIEQLPNKEKLTPDFQEDLQINEFPYQKYRTTHSITSSSSISKNSRDEPLLAPDTLIIGKLYILNESYPSIDHENMNGTPLAFLGAEKFSRIPIDWTKVQYPLSSYYIEIILDLILVRPSFIQEIPKVTKFNLYRPLIKTITGHLFFDHGNNKAGVHQCNRKQILNRKFTIQDLYSLQQREFHIINYNIMHEQRFINLYENLFQIYH